MQENPIRRRFVRRRSNLDEVRYMEKRNNLHDMEKERESEIFDLGGMS